MRSFFLLCLLAASIARADESFGQADPALNQLVGRLYFLPPGTSSLSDALTSLPVEGVLWADRLNVTQRPFTLGFPGVTKRTEWFALVFEGSFVVDTAGSYQWRLHSDDGSKLWIDEQLVVDHDGLHPPTSKSGAVELKSGPHRIRVAYFQGPAQEVALQLFVTPPGLEERVFVVTDFARQRALVFKRLGATATREGTLISLDVTKLFVPGKAELSKESRVVLEDVASALKSTPRAAVSLRGLTTPGPSEESKPGLSEARVAALKRALAERDTGEARLDDKGWRGDGPSGSKIELLIGQ